MSKKNILFALLLLSSTAVYADIGSNITSFFNSMADSISSAFNSFFSSDTLKSLGESFGVVPETYTRSYAIWNDSNVLIYSAQQGMTSMMGGTIANATGMTNASTIASWLNPGTLGAVINPSETSTTADVTAQSVTTGTDYTVFAGAPATLTVLDQHLEFNLYIAQTSSVTSSPLYLEEVTTLNDENSTKVYHYRAYTAKQWSGGTLTHVPRVEFLGYTQPPSTTSDDDSTTTSSETATVSTSLTGLVFLNNTNDDVQVTFTYNSNPLTITLENNSFNSISLYDTTKSLRPNTFVFNDLDSGDTFASVDFGTVGFSGKMYTLEVYQDAGMSTKAVGLQGIVGGNYDTPISARSRDVSPITCNFWRQSVAQSSVDSDSASSLLDLPGQVWVVYDSVDTPIMSKVSVGEAISWQLIRPELATGMAYIYFLYIQTTTDSVAKDFIAEFLYGTMGDGVKSMYSQDAAENSSTAITDFLASLSTELATSTSTLTSDQKVAAMTGDLDYSLGSMTDAAGTVGYLLGADCFASQGIGATTQNYQLSPAGYSISSLVSIFGMYLTKTTLTNATLESLITTYAQNPSTASSLVQNLFVSDNKSLGTTNGNYGLYVNSDNTLTDAGNKALQELLTGPMSLQNPGLYMPVVQNRYALTLSGSSPDGMPATTSVSSTPMPVYSPAA
jgi:hypothetical protein